MVHKIQFDWAIADKRHFSKTDIESCYNVTSITYIVVNIIADDKQGPLLLTWVNFNPGMDK